MLAIIGQVPTFNMNKDYFQEMPENPMFADVAVYNRTVMTAAQLPMVIDKAINAAYEKRDPAVVVIPKDFGWQEIDEYISSTGLYREHTWERPATADEVQAAVDMLIEAKRPYIYFGQGAKGAANELRELSNLLQVPQVQPILPSRLFKVMSRRGWAPQGG